MFYSFTFIIVTLFVSNYCSFCFDVIECFRDNSNVITLKTNTFVHFTSPSFPQTISNLTYSNPCFGNFEKENSSTIYFWIALINGAAKNISANDSTLSINGEFDSDVAIINTHFVSEKFQFQILENASTTLWTAFQGIVGAYDVTKIKCPLAETINNLTDNSFTVIPIVENFLGVEITPVKCKWTFIITKNQMLKVVVQKLLLSETFSLVLYGDGNLMVNFTDYVNSDNITTFHFPGSVFEFEYTSSDGLYTWRSLAVLVSAVEIPGDYSNQGCYTNSINENVTIFSNMDLINGYRSFQYCNFQLPVRSNSIGVISLIDDYIEKCCDELSFNYGSIIFGLIQNPSFRISADVENSTIIFVSDGNTIKAGFSVKYELFECKCPNSNALIDCENPTSFTPLKNTKFHCGLMDCNYTISTNHCQNMYFILSLSANLANADFISLFINSLLIQKVNQTISSYNSELYSLKSNITVTFHSDSDTENVNSNFWSATIIPQKSPNFTKIKLNSAKSRFFISLDEMKVNDAYTICAEIETLQLYITKPLYYMDLSVFVLYDSDDLDQQGIRLDTIVTEVPMDLTTIPSNSGCFTIYFSGHRYNGGNSGTSLLFTIPKEHNKNCNNKENVFKTNSDSESQFSLASNDEGSCEMVILDVDYKMNLETSLNNIYTFSNIGTDKVLLTLNTMNFTTWTIDGMSIPALSIIIPPSSSITVTTVSGYSNKIIFDTERKQGYLLSLEYMNSIRDVAPIMDYEFLSNYNMTLTLNIIEQSGHFLLLMDLITNETQPLEKGDLVTKRGLHFGIYRFEDYPIYLIEYILTQKIPAQTTTQTQENTGATMIIEEDDTTTLTIKHSLITVSNCGSTKSLSILLTLVLVAISCFLKCKMTE